MIVKATVRGDGGQLGAYMLHEEKNERCEIIDSRGFGPGSLSEQLMDMEAETLADTHAKGSFYFTAWRVDEREERLTREMVMWGVNRLEELQPGLKNCPRVVVEQDYGPGSHFHATWNHYDRETGKMVPLKFDARSRLQVAAEMEERFGLRQLNREGFEDRGHARQPEDAQDTRSAKPKKERAAEITALWEQTDSGRAFRAGLEEAGYTLATGKSRAFCVVDGEGEVHSLARQVRGVRGADVAARLSDIDPAAIPEAEAIKAERKAAQAERQRAERQHSEDKPKMTRGERRAAREATAQADAAEIAATEADYATDTGPHVPTPRERSEAEIAATAGMADSILRGVTGSRSTFTRAELEREAAKMTGHDFREGWSSATGGLEALSKDQRAAAERAYERWGEDRPLAASEYGLASYVAYAQRREVERAGVTDPEELAGRAERREAWRNVMAALDASGEIVSVGADPARPLVERFTSRDMTGIEMEMEAAGVRLGMQAAHSVSAERRDVVRAQTEAAQGPDFKFSGEQRAALEHVTQAEGIALVVGYAGAGKSTTLNAARGAWEAEGLRVRGSALSGIAAQGLEQSAGIKSETLWSLLHKLDGEAERSAKADAKISELQAKFDRIKGNSERANHYREDLAAQIGQWQGSAEAGRLSARDVIVVDEAAMIGSRQMGKLLAHAARAGAKVVLVGDHEQVQAIEAGAAFRALMDRHGAAELKDIRRQSEPWQRDATKAFREERTAPALDAYRDQGMTHEAATRDDAKARLIEAWSKSRAERPDATGLILTYLNADVRDLNAMGRAAYRKEGLLGEDHQLTGKDGSITLAEGDRFLFRRNDGHLGVKNGSLGVVRGIDGDKITVALDDAKGRAGAGVEVTFAASEYEHFSHGYASTVHKTQGATVDQAFVLATPGMDRHIAYVAMSRHRDRADLFHGRDDFKDHDAMTRRLSRSGAKDSVLDYLLRASRNEGEALPQSFRSTVAAVWSKVREAFGLRGDHPAELAARTREAEVQAKRDAGASKTTDQKGQDKQAEAAAAIQRRRDDAAKKAEDERREAARKLAEAQRNRSKPRGFER